MLPKINRIRKSAEYTNVFKKSKKLTTEHFKFYINFAESAYRYPTSLTPNQDINTTTLNTDKGIYNVQTSKLGIIIPAKLINASKRNHLKRQIRNILHHPVKNSAGINLVIKAVKYKENLSFEELKQELKSSLDEFLKM